MGFSAKTTYGLLALMELADHVEGDAKTRAPIAELKHLLKNVPQARLFEEILKLLLSGNAVDCVRVLRETKGRADGGLVMIGAVVAAGGGDRVGRLLDRRCAG